MSKISALDVMKWFYKNNETIREERFDSKMKMQALAYYSQVLHYKILRGPLFNDPINYWNDLPYFSEIELSKDILEEENVEIRGEKLKILQFINSFYGSSFAVEVMSQTRKEIVEIKKRYSKLNCEVVDKYYPKLKELFDSYDSFSFKNDRVETINGNNFQYNKENINSFTGKELSRLYEMGDREKNKTYALSRFVDVFGKERLTIY